MTFLVFCVIVSQSFAQEYVNKAITTIGSGVLEGGNYKSIVSLGEPSGKGNVSEDNVYSISSGFIYVAEEPCKIARGVPFETVFTVCRAGCAKRSAKILKAAVDVNADDVVEMVRTQLSTDDAPDLHHVYGYMEGLERAVATPYVPDDEPVEEPTYMTETGASLPNPDAEEHYLVDMVCDPASLPGPIRRALMLQGKT